MVVHKGVVDEMCKLVAGGRSDGAVQAKALELLEEWGMQLRIIEYSQVGAYTRPLFGLS